VGGNVGMNNLDAEVHEIMIDKIIDVEKKVNKLLKVVKVLV